MAVSKFTAQAQLQAASQRPRLVTTPAAAPPPIQVPQPVVTVVPDVAVDLLAIRRKNNRFSWLQAELKILSFPLLNILKAGSNDSTLQALA